jgi:hypothetical protein
MSALLQKNGPERWPGFQSGRHSLDRPMVTRVGSALLMLADAVTAEERAL